eukprot:2738693-Alexandrium_andersonii.AAC.1
MPLSRATSAAALRRRPTQCTPFHARFSVVAPPAVDPATPMRLKPSSPRRAVPLEQSVRPAARSPDLLASRCGHGLIVTRSTASS